MIEHCQIITFYCFKDMSGLGALNDVRSKLLSDMLKFSVKGTIILAGEGFNATVSGRPEDIAAFVSRAQYILDEDFDCKSSFHDMHPFRRTEVKIKSEIVTLKTTVDISLGAGTHVLAKEWNRIISDPQTIIIDTRNDYEFRTGTFRGAVNPSTTKFSDLPEFVEQHLDPSRHSRVAMFCTGGIRCEKFAPYLKARGFREVYQLKGGILRYLDEVPPEQSLWEGECFVFDERVTVNESLEKGNSKDLSSYRYADEKL